MLVSYRKVELAEAVLDLSFESREQMLHLAWHFGPLRAAERAPDLTIQLQNTAPSRPLLRGASLLDGPVTRRSTRTGVHLRHEAGPRGLLTGDRLMIGGAARPPERWRAARQLLLAALSWFFDGRGMLVLHAAMIGRGDDAALVLGATGSGKSTLAAAALQAGWELFSDDLVVVAQGRRGPATFGIPKRVCIAPDIAARLAISLDEAPGDGRGRLMLPATTMSVGWRDIRALIHVEHDHAGGRIATLSHDDAMAAVLAAFLEADRPASVRRHLGLLGALTGQPAVTLAHAADAGNRLTRAAALLDDAWAATAPVTGGVSTS